MSNSLHLAWVFLRDVFHLKSIRDFSLAKQRKIKHQNRRTANIEGS